MRLVINLRSGSVFKTKTGIFIKLMNPEIPRFAKVSDYLVWAADVKNGHIEKFDPLEQVSVVGLAALAVQSSHEEPIQIVLKDISYGQAKKKIKEYFSKHHGEIIDAADIQEALKIDISLVIEVLDDLKREGKIKEGGKSSSSRWHKKQRHGLGAALGGNYETK